MKLWIDDVRPAPPGWYWTKTSQEAIGFLSQNLYTVVTISFDHDLGGDDTTMPVIRYLEELVYHGTVRAPKMLVHSMNPVGRANLQRAIDRIQRF
jgi:hypothetical protein